MSGAAQGEASFVFQSLTIGVETKRSKDNDNNDDNGDEDESSIASEAKGPEHLETHKRKELSLGMEQCEHQSQALWCTAQRDVNRAINQRVCKPTFRPPKSTLVYRPVNL